MGRSARSYRIGAGLSKAGVVVQGDALFSARQTGLPKDSAANVSRILTLDKDLLTDCTGKRPRAKLELLPAGIDVVLGK